MFEENLVGGDRYSRKMLGKVERSIAAALGPEERVLAIGVDTGPGSEVGVVTSHQLLIARKRSVDNISFDRINQTRLGQMNTGVVVFVDGPGISLKLKDSAQANAFVSVLDSMLGQR